MILFSSVGEAIIFIGAIATALIAIINFLKGPRSLLRKYLRKGVNEEVNSVLADRTETCYQKLENRVLERLESQIAEVKKINENQSALLETFNRSLKDMLRQQIMTIYDDYYKVKKLPMAKRQLLNQLYRDYKAQKGNTFVDTYYTTMQEWETIEDEEMIVEETK